MPEEQEDQGLVDLLRKAKQSLTSTQEMVAPYQPDADIVGEPISPNTMGDYLGRKEQFKQEVEREVGAPVDVGSGAPWAQRFAASFRTDPKQVVRYWQEQYGEDNVKLLKSGDLLVGIPDAKTKKNRYVVVDEPNFTGKDLVDLAGTAPEIAMTIVSMIGAKRLPGAKGKVISEATGLGGLTRDVTAAAGGQFGGGLIKDAIAGDFRPVERLKEVPVNMAYDVGGSVVNKVLGSVISPFSKFGPQQTDAAEARQWVKENLNLNYPFTPAEKTGSKLLGRVEAYQEALPGGSKRFEDIRRQQQDVVSQAQNVLQGVPQTATPEQREAMIPTMDRLLARVRHAVQKQTEPLEQGVANAREKLVTEANQEILNEISAATIPQRVTNQRAMGEAIRGAVEARRKDFLDENARLYGETRKLPGGTDRILVTPNLAQRAKDYLEKDIAGAEITQTVPTGLLNQFGAPITTTQAVQETAKNFIPSDVLGRLQELARLGSGRFSLEDLKAMRNDVSNAIAVGESVPGYKTHHLKEIYKMISEGMNDAVNSIPDQRLKIAWQKANDHYAKNVGQFHTRTIVSILKPDDAAGYLGNRQIIDTLIRGEDKIDELKNFLGANSPEYQMFKRNIADTIFNDHFDMGQQTVKAKGFLDAMYKFRRDNEDLFNEVFGSRASKILSSAQHAAVGQADKLDAALVEQGIRNPGRSLNLVELITAERARDKAYKNDILKSVGAKSFPGTGFDANDFVNRFIRSSSAAEIKPVMNAIKDEGLLWQVRAKTMEDLLREVASNPTATDRLNPSLGINTGKLQEIFKNRERREALEAIVGPEKLELLKRIGQLTKPTEAKHGAFRSAASLAGGAQVSALERGGIVHFASGALLNKVISTALLIPGLERYVGNTVWTPARQHQFLVGILSSVPFVRSATDDFGTGGAKKLIEDAQRKGDQWYQEHQANPQFDQQGTNNAKALRLLQQL